MDQSVFLDKQKIPDDTDLKNSLGKTYKFWEKTREFVLQNFPDGMEEWNYPGDKYGWSFRIKDKKRAILYFLPRDGFFKVAFVFGQKATDLILASDISAAIKEELKAARVYAEGRGIRIEVLNEAIMKDVFDLIKIKLAN
jgi:hypothetical protein